MLVFGLARMVPEAARFESILDDAGAGSVFGIPSLFGMVGLLLLIASALVSAFGLIGVIPAGGG